MRLEKCSGAGRNKHKPHIIKWGYDMKRVSREHLVAFVPPVRVLNRVGLNVPVAVLRVPVSVHGPDYRAKCHLCHCPLNTLRAV